MHKYHGRPVRVRVPGRINPCIHIIPVTVFKADHIGLPPGIRIKRCGSRAGLLLCFSPRFIGLYIQLPGLVHVRIIDGQPFFIWREQYLISSFHTGNLYRCSPLHIQAIKMGNPRVRFICTEIKMPFILGKLQRLHFPATRCQLLFFAGLYIGHINMCIAAGLAPVVNPLVVKPGQITRTGPANPGLIPLPVYRCKPPLVASSFNSQRSLLSCDAATITAIVPAAFQ
ncbi:hypothetical protein D3C87_1201260 [compost metagenome]